MKTTRLTKEQLAQLQQDRRQALLSWFRIVRKALPIGVSFDESMLGVVSFARQGQLKVMLYRNGTSVTRQRTIDYVKSVTGDVLEPERSGGDLYDLLKDRCFAIRIRPSDGVGGRPEHKMIMVGWKDSISYTSVDHFVTINIPLDESMPLSEKRRLFGKRGERFVPRLKA